MSVAALERPYTLRSIREMLGVSRAVVGGFIAAGFIAPTRGPRNQLRFGFNDVALLRTACGQPRGRMPAKRLLRSLRRLRASLPATLPAEGVRLAAVGDDIAIRRAGEPLAVASGQLLFDFDAAAKARPVALRPRDPRAAAAMQDDDADAWFAHGEAAEAADLAGAEAAYRRALARAPGHRDACLNLGALLCEAGRSAEALPLYDAALAQAPGDALLHFNHAIALEDLGQSAAALAAYERSVVLAPDLADAHFNAARLYRQHGNAQKALRHLSAYRRLQAR